MILIGLLIWSLCCRQNLSNFAAVIDGHIALDAAEQEALSRLTEQLGLDPRDLDVSGDLFAPQSAWILDGHVIAIKFSGLPLESLQGFPQFSKLEKLEIKSAKLISLQGLQPKNAISQISIQDSGLQQVDGLDGCLLLRDLNLRNNRIESLESLASLPKLQSLDVAHNLIQEAVGLTAVMSLESLDISDNHLKTLEHIAYLPKLKHLNVARNQLSTLQGLEQLSSINAVFADQNKLQNASALDQLSQLQQLNLNDNQLMNFPVCVSRFENIWWSSNPGYANRLASDFDEHRKALLEKGWSQQLPEAKTNEGDWSLGSVTWSGNRPSSESRLALLESPKKIYLARYKSNPLKTDKRRFGVSGVVVQLSCDTGQVRIYLAQQAIVEDGQTRIAYPYIEANASQDKAMAGQLFNDGLGVWFIIEPVNGPAAGVRYRITPGYTP